MDIEYKDDPEISLKDIFSLGFYMKDLDHKMFKIYLLTKIDSIYNIKTNLKIKHIQIYKINGLYKV